MFVSFYIEKQHSANGMKKLITIFSCEILSPGIWNSEGSSSEQESNPLTIGIRNLISTERLTKNPESRAWNPESKTVP